MLAASDESKPTATLDGQVAGSLAPTATTGEIWRPKNAKISFGLPGIPPVRQFTATMSGAGLLPPTVTVAGLADSNRLAAAPFVAQPFPMVEQLGSFPSV